MENFIVFFLNFLKEWLESDVACFVEFFYCDACFLMRCVSCVSIRNEFLMNANFAESSCNLNQPGPSSADFLSSSDEEMSEQDLFYLNGGDYFSLLGFLLLLGYLADWAMAVGDYFSLLGLKYIYVCQMQMQK